VVDIHCHIVPGVDDGAASLEMSLAMIEDARRSGVTSILTTPHIRGCMEDAFVHELHKQAFQTVLDAKPAMDLHLGGEVRVTPETHRVTDRPEFTADERSKYILLELEFDKVPSYFSQVLFEYRLHGITPIIAHPERNVGILKNPEYALDFVRQGAHLQVTTGSILGELGESFEQCAHLLLECGLVSMLSSDAHNTTTRPFTNWPGAYEFMQEFEKKGNFIRPITANDVCTNNAAAVCNGTPLAPVDLDENAISAIRARLSQITPSTVKRKRFFLL